MTEQEYSIATNYSKMKIVMEIINDIDADNLNKHEKKKFRDAKCDLSMTLAIFLMQLSLEEDE